MKSDDLEAFQRMSCDLGACIFFGEGEKPPEFWETRNWLKLKFRKK